jgi:eukaryotic-like serine/threonine-protein kinase
MRCPQCETLTQSSQAFCLSCGARVAPAPNDPMLGRTLLNQYIIQRRLGQGGYGAVYEAIQPSVGRKAAIKTLHAHLSHQPELVVRFHREGLATSRLTHPAVVKIFNFGETDDGILWFAMELIEGETLGERIKRLGPLSAQELVAALTPICEALQEAHEKKIIHRDLKPDNIMLIPERDGPFTPKLLDFGVAGLIDEIQVTQSGMMSGSPQYMPPEQWRGLKYTDHRSDLYSLGIVAYQCLSGVLPFEADTAPSWMQKHCLETPIELSTLRGVVVPVAMQEVLKKALSKVPDDRFQSAVEFKQALQDSLRGVAPKRLTPPAPASQDMPSAVLTLRANSLPSALLGAIAATAAVLLILLALGFFTGPSTPLTNAEEKTDYVGLTLKEPSLTSAPGPGDAFSNPPTSERALSTLPPKPSTVPTPLHLTTTPAGKGTTVVKPTEAPIEAPAEAPPLEELETIEVPPPSAPTKKRPLALTRTEEEEISFQEKRAAKVDELYWIIKGIDFSSCGNRTKMYLISMTLLVSPNGKVISVNSAMKDAANECAKAIAKGLRFPTFDEEFGNVFINFNTSVF